MCTDRIVCIHPSAAEHLGVLHLLATVNNAAVNPGVQTSVQVPFSDLGIYTIKLLDQMVIPFTEELPHHFPQNCVERCDTRPILAVIPSNVSSLRNSAMTDDFQVMQNSF